MAKAELKQPRRRREARAVAEGQQPEPSDSHDRTVAHGADTEGKTGKTSTTPSAPDPDGTQPHGDAPEPDPAEPEATTADGAMTASSGTDAADASPAQQPEPEAQPQKPLVPPAPGPTGESRAYAARLRGLQTKMAHRFDPVAFDHAERLGRRAHALSASHPAAGSRLWARANLYLDEFEARFNASRARALQDAKRLVKLGLLRPPQAKRGLEQGLLLRLRQLARRYPAKQQRVRERVYHEWQTTVAGEAQRRGLMSPLPTSDANGTEPPSADPAGLATALYHDAVSSLQARLAIDRAVEQLPVEAGRYHATTVATRALQVMQGAPPYLKAQLSRLEGLALLTSYFTPVDTSDGARSEKRAAPSRGGPRKNKPKRNTPNRKLGKATRKE